MIGNLKCECDSLERWCCSLCFWIGLGNSLNWSILSYLIVIVIIIIIALIMIILIKFFSFHFVFFLWSLYIHSRTNRKPSLFLIRFIFPPFKLKSTWIVCCYTILNLIKRKQRKRESWREEWNVRELGNNGSEVEFPDVDFEKLF